MERLEDLRKVIKAEAPYVVITDFKKGLKNALLTVWPEVQQQICLWHINKNVVYEVKKRWVWLAGAAPPDDPEVDETDDHVDPIFRDLVAIAVGDAPSTGVGKLPAKVPNTPQGLLELWKYVCYAITEADFEEAWVRILEDFLQQEEVIRYLQATYLPLRSQWADYCTRQYRNFGIRVTSRTEGSHKEIKSYLRNSYADLFFLAERIKQLIVDREHQFKADEATEAQRMVRDYQQMKWLGDTKTKLSRKAVKLIVKQHDILINAYRRNPGMRSPLPPCTDSFTKQFGLPCAHRISAMLQRNQSLNYLMTHKHWHLGHDRVSYIYDSRAIPALISLFRPLKTRSWAYSIP